VLSEAEPLSYVNNAVDKLRQKPANFN